MYFFYHEKRLLFRFTRLDLVLYIEMPWCRLGQFWGQQAMQGTRKEPVVKIDQFLLNNPFSAMWVCFQSTSTLMGAWIRKSLA